MESEKEWKLKGMGGQQGGRRTLRGPTGVPGEKIKLGDHRRLFEKSFRNWVRVSGTPDSLWSYLFIQNLNSESQKRIFAFEPNAEKLSFQELCGLFHQIFTSPAEARLQDQFVFPPRSWKSS